MIDNVKYQEFIFNFKTREVRQTFINTNYKPKKEMKLESSTSSKASDASDESDSSGEDSESEVSTESSRDGEPQSDSLEEQIAISIGNIEHELNRFYYTDAAYEQGQAIVAEYTEKISAAASPEEAKAFENEAMDKLSTVPRSTTPV